MGPCAQFGSAGQPAGGASTTVTLAFPVRAVPDWVRFSTTLLPLLVGVLVQNPQPVKVRNAPSFGRLPTQVPVRLAAGGGEGGGRVAGGPPGVVVGGGAPGVSSPPEVAAMTAAAPAAANTVPRMAVLAPMPPPVAAVVSVVVPAPPAATTPSAANPVGT